MKKESNSEGELFIKFSPWNVNTISALVNKTVKFSTVYEFNDFNEARFICAYENKMDKQKELVNAFNASVNSCEKRQTLIENTKLLGYYTDETLENLPKTLNNISKNPTSLEKEAIMFAAESLAFSSVGIFCLSHIDVFKDDAAQLMFAHYAQNLKGVALIYRSTKPNSASSVTYLDTKSVVSIKANEILNAPIEWSKGNYSKLMFKFTQKSKYWEYENEYRFFGTPGIKKSQDVGLDLVSVLYTPRFSDRNLNALLKISKEICKIDIFRIGPKIGEYQFRLKEESASFNEDNKSIHEWLKKNDFKKNTT